MWAPISHASSCSRRAYASARLTLPARMDLISVPVRTSPASKVSSIVKSCRARRLRATVCSSPTVACSFERVARRTNAGPISGRRPVAEPPAGCSVLDGQLLRGGAATATVDHCTSPPFVRGNPTGTVWLAQAILPSGTSGGDAQLRSRLQQLDRLVQHRILASWRIGRNADRDVRGDPDVVDPPTVGRQPLRDGQPVAAGALESRPFLDCPLAERRLADQRRPLPVLERARDDLAGRRAALVDEDLDFDARVGRDSARFVFGRRLTALSILLPEDGPRADELARDRARGRNEPARVSPKVDDQLLDPIADVLGDGVVERRRGRVREAGQADVANRSVGQRLRDDLALNDDVAGDRQVERRRLGADDAQGDRRAALAADFVARLVDREPVELRAVDGDDHVARLHPGLLGGRTFDRGDDDELAVPPHRRAVAPRSIPP